jgi:DNA-binding NarL/FixJ family response regulator
MKTRVLLADDHGLFRAGVRRLLATLDAVEVVAEADNGHEAVRIAEEKQPELVLMDIMMPGLNGVEAAARIARTCPQTRVIMVSMNADGDSVLKALRAGAFGYLVKTADPAELELAVRAAMRGERFLSSAISGHVVGGCLGRTEPEQTSLERLTPRQREVLQLIAEGNTSKEIARTLGIAVKTADCYRAELMKSLDLHDIASLTRYAIRAGVISVSG